MLHKKTIHLNKTTLICLLLYVIVIVSCRGYRFYLPQQYQYIHMQIFGFFSVVSLIYFFILFKRIKKVDNYINKYMIILAGGFVIPQFLYTHSRYNQSLSDFYSAAQHYFFLIWIIPLFYLLLNSNSEKVLDTIARMPCFAICIALFEYIYVSCNKLEMKGIGNFSLWPQVIKYIKPKSFKNMNFIQHWKKSMIYFIPTVATMVYTVLDKSMIGWITGSEFQNGYYEQAYKIEQILLVFVTTVGTVTFPRMAYFFENDNKEERKRIMGITMKFIMLIACPICFGTMAISENLIPVFLGKGYEECILLLRIFSFLIIIIGLDNTIGKQCLISAGKQKEYNIGVIGGAIVNFVTNILLISKLGACGAAIASVFAESVILVVFIIYSKVELKIPKLSMCFFKYFISAMCMSIMVWRIGILISNKLVALSVQIFVGIILYGLFLLLMKDEFVMESIRRVKLKI